MRNNLKSFIVGFLLVPSLVLAGNSTDRQKQIAFNPGQFFQRNFVLNPDAEQNTSNVTVSGATVTRNTTTPIEGKADFSVSLGNNATDTVTWTIGTLDSTLKSGNCELRLNYTASSIGSNVKFGVYQGSNLIASTLALATQSVANPTVSLNAPCGDLSSATTVKLYNDTGNSGTSSLKIDHVYYGSATNIGSAIIETDWKSYTPTFGADFGTPTSVSFFYKLIGDTLYVQGTFTTGTLSAANGGISIPGGYTIDSTKVSVNNNNTSAGPVVGFWTQGDHSNYMGNIVTATASSTSAVFIANQFSNASPGPLVAGAFNGIGFSTTKTAVNFAVPIVGSSTMTTFSPNLQALSWSGYHSGSDCSWSTTSTSYADPSDDASCTFTERTNTNFGTVTTYGASKPGFTWIPKKIGKYYVCGRFPMYNNTANKEAAVQIWDGTTVIGTARTNQNGTASELTSVSVCGIYNVSAISSVSIRAQIRAESSSTTFISGNTGAESAEWSIFALDQNIPAPVLVGSVTATNTTSVVYGAIGGASDETSCTGTCTIYGSSGEGTTASRSATGDYSLTFPSGVFKSGTIPKCTCNAVEVGTGFRLCAPGTGGSNTSFLMRVRNPTSLAATDGYVVFSCVGQR